MAGAAHWEPLPDLGAAMKVFRNMPWFAALLPRRSAPPTGLDAADMGTAFGLESVTVVNPFKGGEGLNAAPADPVSHWQRRVNGRSRI
jgi:hypothetical protein